MIVGISLMKNEQDVAGHVVEHMLEEGLDSVVVADNLSTDGTRDILEDLRREYPDQLDIIDDDEPGYYQSQKTSAMAHRAGEELGATWVVPFDADEIWLAPDRVAVWLRGMDPDIREAHATLYNHHPTAADPPGDNPFETIVWRMIEPGAMPKVAFRYEPGVVVEMGNHSVTFPKVGGKVGGGLSIRHFSNRSFAQFKAKVITGAAAYEATDLPYSFGAHWRSYKQILDNGGDDALREVFARWFWHASPVDEGLVHDPAPFRRWPRLRRRDCTATESDI